MSRSVDVHSFSMIPRAEIPRSKMVIESQHKTTFDAGYLVPIYVDEVLPGDSHNVRMSAFARMSTPLFPIMDNLHMDSFFFFVPMRLVWNNWHKFNGEQENPGDSTSFVIPKLTSPVGGYAANSLFDYFGLPTVGQVDAASSVTHNALPLRAYNLIYNEWFRDENLVDRLVVNKGDGPDTPASYALQRRGKRHDYFTSCLPWPQKGESVGLPLGSVAPIKSFNDGTATQFKNVTNQQSAALMSAASGTAVTWSVGTGAVGGMRVDTSNMYADLAGATAATINQLRQSFQIQKLLERDARGGTRLTEIIRSHFGVISPDARMQRPEYLGGGSTPVNINPIAQTSATGQTGSTTPLGKLGGIGTMVSTGNGFSQSFTEHGYVIGLVSVRADLSYQQGLRKLWSRSTRFDFYWPVFAALGEQAVLNKEIYVTGTASDDAVFGYQERWSEYRHHPSLITGLFRSTTTGTLDGWHLSQRFTSVPTLNKTFIDDTPPLDRALAVGEVALGRHFIFDSFFQAHKARPMPMFSVPGLIDHF